MTSVQHPESASCACAIDWGRPWFAPYREWGQRIAARWGSGVSLVVALNEEVNHAESWPQLEAGRLRFVPQGDLPRGVSYESFIAASACVPTRENLHDFFNALVWLSFPAIKQRLNALHVAHQPVEVVGGGASRGVVRDAVTVFDENAACWRAPVFLQEALRRRDWREVFVMNRVAWPKTSFTVIGHALLEKLCQPRKGITAHVWCVPEGAPQVESLLDQLRPDRLVSRSWCPLPVLGVPGWWPANQNPDFYDDLAVFRPIPSANAVGGPLSHLGGATATDHP